MEGEHEDQRKNIFNHHQQDQQYQQQQQQHHHHHQNPLRECQTSEEEDHSHSQSQSSGGGHQQRLITPHKKPKKSETNTPDGSSIEVVRRSRGRPPGSKNKPKPPIIVTRDAECAMRPHVLEVPGGLDVVDSIARFARRRNVGLCVLAGSGTVANVTLRQPSTTPGATITFHGRFEILSISATFLPPASSITGGNGFTISLAGAQGQIVGGSVVGSLLAAGTVVVIAAVFSSPSYHRLPGEDEMPASVSAGNDTPAHTTQGENCGSLMYSCHLPSDVIWPPTARQPPPPPPF